MSQDSHSDKGGGGNYWRFMAMVSTSTVIMFFLMYTNSFDADDLFWSETRFWMMFVMGGAMMIVMLLFMWGMYKDRTKNFIILGVGAITMALALWLVRSQTTVDDTEYMAAMIPHHSIAIMTSERAHIKDPEVRKLADGIIDAQVREIAQMKQMIARLQANPAPDGAPDLPSYRDRGASPPPPQTDESTGIDTRKPIS